MFSQWSCHRDEETCSSIACVENVLADTGFKTKTFTSLWRFEVQTFEPKESVDEWEDIAQELLYVLLPVDG
jgi:hypothetical protein